MVTSGSGLFLVEEEGRARETSSVDPGVAADEHGPMGSRREGLVVVGSGGTSSVMGVAVDDDEAADETGGRGDRVDWDGGGASLGSAEIVVCCSIIVKSISTLSEDEESGSPGTAVVMLMVSASLIRESRKNSNMCPR